MPVGWNSRAWGVAKQGDARAALGHTRQPEDLDAVAQLAKASFPRAELERPGHEPG
jgi:hypothetical protein